MEEGGLEQKYWKLEQSKKIQTRQSPEQQTRQQASLTQFHPTITYIWFGKQIPQDYLIKLSAYTYPVQFISNPKIQRKFTRTLKQIQKADFYRLQYLYQHGGIYSDFDNQINYQCMQKVLFNYRNSDQVIFWWDTKRNLQTRNVVPNSFIYANKPLMPALKNILQSINQSNADLKFAGMQYLAKFGNKDLVQVKQLYECIKHEYDFSWVEQSGKKQKSEKDKLKGKKIKKQQLIAQVESLKSKLKNSTRQYQILQSKYNQTKDKLMKQYRSHYVQSEQKKLNQSKQVIVEKGIASVRQSDRSIVQNKLSVKKNKVTQKDELGKYKDQLERYKAELEKYKDELEKYKVKSENMQMKTIYNDQIPHQKTIKSPKAQINTSSNDHSNPNTKLYNFINYDYNQQQLCLVILFLSVFILVLAYICIKKIVKNYQTQNAILRKSYPKRKNQKTIFNQKHQFRSKNDQCLNFQVKGSGNRLSVKDQSDRNETYEFDRLKGSEEFHRLKETLSQQNSFQD